MTTVQSWAVVALVVGVGAVGLTVTVMAAIGRLDRTPLVRRINRRYDDALGTSLTWTGPRFVPGAGRGSTSTKRQEG